tara:strand:+ start:1667 stop:1891 length:225 start_codon:yes stop_codon:yes gene_type:complete
MKTPYKMKGYSYPGTSPVKDKNKGVDFNDPDVRKNYEEHKDNPNYQAALALKQGGKTTYSAKDNKSTTTSIKKN